VQQDALIHFAQAQRLADLFRAATLDVAQLDHRALLGAGPERLDEGAILHGLTVALPAPERKASSGLESHGLRGWILHL
jgi:hypothetical protein